MPLEHFYRISIPELKALCVTVFRNRGIKFKRLKTGTKNFFLRQRENNYISEPQFKNLLELLLFRHLHVHGYGYMLDEERLRELARPVHALCDELLKGIE